MKQSVLDIIARQDFRHYDGWRNGKKGHINDFFCNGVYRFFEDEPDGDDSPRQKEIKDNPIVAVGIVAYWLEHRHGDETVRQMYENYTQRRFEQFKKCLKDDAETWDWEEEDWKRFFYLKASEREAHWNKMSEPLFDFITESDAQRVRPVMDNYIKYLDKCREAYQTSSTDVDKEKLIDKIYIFFKDEETAKRFLKQLEALDKDEAKIELVKKYKDSNLCLNTSKALWKVLSEAGFYRAGYPNWNKQMNQI